MDKQIAQFLMTVKGKKSNKTVRKLVAEHFGGTLTSNGRYVKIGDDEWYITNNPDNVECGFDIRKMDWGIGNDWRFAQPY